MSKQRIIVMSLAQLVKTNSPIVSVMKFADKTGLDARDIGSLLQTEKAAFINEYKRGQIDNEAFFQGIRDLLEQTQLSDEDIKECWNAMCVFSEGAKEEVQKFIAFLKDNPNYKVVFVSETNQIQHEFNIQQLEEVVGTEEVGELCNQILYITSYGFEVLGKLELAQRGLETLQESELLADSKDIEAIISFHDAMPSRNLLLEGMYTTSVVERKYVDIQTTKDSNVTEVVINAHAGVERELSSLGKQVG